MVVVPEFLIKRIYQKGSLKKLDNGASVALKNVLADQRNQGNHSACDEQKIIGSYFSEEYQQKT